MLKGLRGSNKRVWWFINILFVVGQKRLIFKGLEWGITFYVFLLDFLYNLELLEDFLAYNPFCYCIQTFVCKKHLGNIVCICINK